MTSIAVTASKCANASEVALLVACFMPFLPRPGHDSSLRENAQERSDFYSEHPTIRIRLMSSPRSEYRLCQARTVLRRQFDSGVLLVRR